MGRGRVMGSHGFERRTPPEGYVCHRCKVPGHFIQHRPTNGDPNYDIKRVRLPIIYGATNVLADHLVPNMTLRDTINRMSDSDSSSVTNGGSVPQALGNESRNSQPKAPSSAHSEVSKGAQLGEVDSKKIEAQGPHKVDNGDNEVITPNTTSERAQNREVVKSGDTLERVSVKEPALQGIHTPVAGKEHAKPAKGDSAKKKKVKKAQMSVNGPEMNWVAPQYFPDESYMMHMAPAAYNPYWTGPYACVVPYMGFGHGPLPSPSTGVFPQDQSFGPACSIPFGVPQRNVADLGMRSNVAPSLKRNEEPEATKKDLKRKREMDTRRVYSLAGASPSGAPPPA